MYINVVREHKFFIQDIFYTFKDFSTKSAVVLAGPDYERVMELCTRFVEQNVNSYELEYDTWRDQMVFAAYNLHKPVLMPVHTNVMHADTANFMDIDLMRSFVNDGKIIEGLLSRQIDEVEGKRVFIGTLSLMARQYKKEDTFTWLEETLSMIGNCKIFNRSDIDSDATGKGRYRVRYNVLHDDNFKRVDVFTYSDGQGPMMTFKIVY